MGKGVMECLKMKKKKILREQIMLLAETSKTVAGPDFLARLSLAMSELAKLL